MASGVWPNRFRHSNLELEWRNGTDFSSQALPQSKTLREVL
jgi:hypothetical protein